MIRHATRFGTKYYCGFWTKKNKETANIDRYYCRRMHGPPRCASCARHRVRSRLHPPLWAVLWSPRKPALTISFPEPDHPKPAPAWSLLEAFRPDDLELLCNADY